MSSTNSREIAAFLRLVWRHWKEDGRHDLPWRKTTDPYKILVSEVMLQQTPVSRVVGRYESFIERFPTIRALARAELKDVLRQWSGLGYNRRGKYLHDSAKEIVTMHAGDFREALRHSLPGIGPYTRSAVRIFSFNERDILIETNIRTALMRHFARSTLKVSDSTLLVYARKIAKKQDPRKWHWALMDYGAYLKKTGVRNNSRSVHYVKQSKFEGSLRQMRGEILRQLHAGKQPRGDERMTRALSSLARDGLIVRQKGKWRIA